MGVLRSAEIIPPGVAPSHSWDIIRGYNNTLQSEMGTLAILQIFWDSVR